MSFSEAHKKILKALKDEDLRKGSFEATKEEIVNRRKAIERHPYVIKWAGEIRELKRDVLNQKESLLEKFKNSFLGENKYFYFADSKEDMKSIVLKIIGDKKLIVKSKSLVGEEVELRQFLEKHEINIYETDLGEFLVQLVNGKPAHMVTPAVNMTEEKARMVLQPFINEKLDDIISMVLGVRKFMREKFLSAEVGIIGANALAADTGSIIFITNEGNGALSSILPEKLIVVTSIEKIYKRFLDAFKASIVQTNYSGFKNTSYIHILNGVSNVDFPGPKELHLVLLNNGRIREDFLKETLACIKCGSCQLSCPIFHVIDGSWGHIYTAAIGIPWTAITGSIRIANDLSYFCLGCGRCKEVCPMDIDIPDIIRKLKKVKANMMMH